MGARARHKKRRVVVLLNLMCWQISQLWWSYKSNQFHLGWRKNGGGRFLGLGTLLEGENIVANISRIIQKIHLREHLRVMADLFILSWTQTPWSVKTENRYWRTLKKSDISLVVYICDNNKFVIYRKSCLSSDKLLSAATQWADPDVENEFSLLLEKSLFACMLSQCGRCVRADHYMNKFRKMASII